MNSYNNVNTHTEILATKLDLNGVLIDYGCLFGAAVGIHLIPIPFTNCCVGSILGGLLGGCIESDIKCRATTTIILKDAPITQTINR